MGFFGSTPKQQQYANRKSSKQVHFAPPPLLASRHAYPFDWSIESAVWYSRDELNALKEDRFNEADALRRERGISTSSRDDADKIADGREKEIWVGDTMTHALDDRDEGLISVRGIEHFVWPVLQKEMVTRKKELKKFVVDYSKDKQRRMSDPNGDKLAEACAARSRWARDAASERGIKYCQMKRGAGRGGGLLKNTKMILERRKLETSRRSLVRRESLVKAFRRMSSLGRDVEEA
ncbi:hypothetical protein HJC23_001999 [Cyclotella cryptica]|uniref:Uncharacterized protein n=1 Tax=Cyclotella cryptica TaxID=29204 RepID=A0ABD3P1H8_9STRA|eukprot:CCRYP_018383-RA/>CCRYP_018383-RA protein AED:0.05 eAED:0.05 QI:150/1/1/1/1/1/2/220/235